MLFPAVAKALQTLVYLSASPYLGEHRKRQIVLKSKPESEGEVDSRALVASARFWVQSLTTVKGKGGKTKP